ncbi:PaaX domain-containing protein, C- domain protein [Rhodococcus spelaei]|uniref:PaaX domain-containing protein, C-domain protein n=1 Tax=Rhodococcus spelaei TaxID=2546320 RepID=A0A541BAN6_9NOCA|nr:PaaX family transcriptional regulator C-terminal domain-containing protein [Rhodococcus spelaei]TQF69405.1 PaaX domain-containing protein, C- domain protein [Rhodococcus spelaei]
MPVRTLAELAPPMTARSVVLSLLLGIRPARMPGREITRIGELFGIASSTMRAALSRMVAAGDLVSTDSMYLLGARHLERQALQEALVNPRRTPFDGGWDMVVVVVSGREAGARGALRMILAEHRYAELREGVWMRPANLAGHDLPPLDEVHRFTTVPENADALVAQLWELDTWAAEARLVLAALTVPEQSEARFMAAAAAVRHLRTDPALPDELLPENWPADELRWAYDDYRAQFAELSMREEVEDKP